MVISKFLSPYRLQTLKLECAPHKQLPELAGQLPAHPNRQVSEYDGPSICWRKL